MEMGKKIKGGKREKEKENLGELISKPQFNTFQTLTSLFFCFMGKKIIDFKTQRVVLWERKSKASIYS